MDPSTDETRAPVHIKLWNILIVSAALVFVLVLVLLTGDVAAVWPLFALPIVLGGALLRVPGAVVATAASALCIILTGPGAAYASGAAVPLTAGIGAFALCGIIVGAQASRAQRRAIALEESSFRDPETGLYRPSIMRQRLIEEVRRAERHGVELGLVVVRVDGLAAFRDTFGAYKAGLLMEHLADVLRITVRDTDVVGRYGPESFGVVLPFAGPAPTMLVADRVRLAACSAEFEGDVLEPSTHCPVSVAHAAYPVDALSVESLVAIVADRLGDTAPDYTAPAPRVPLRLGEARP